MSWKVFTRENNKRRQFCIHRMATTKKLSTSAAMSGRLDLIMAVRVVHDNQGERNVE